MTKLLISAVFVAGLLASHPVLATEKTVTLAVQNMYCAACPSTVRKSLQAVPGVGKVVVSFEDKSAVVTFDDTLTNLKVLTAATTNAGYPSVPRR